MRIEGINTILQRLDVAHLIATLFQNAEKAAKIVSSQSAQQLINESVQKPTQIEKTPATEDEKHKKKPGSKKTHDLDIVA
ncbi:MAG: hypothetical protein ACK4NF_00570 [Planctomycetota bacterium]